MKTIHIMGVQLTSLLCAILCADSILNDIFSTIIFLISFVTFAVCSIYISHHSAELLQDIDDYYNSKQ